MTMELAKCDADLRDLVSTRSTLQAQGWDPDELANLSEDIDDLLDRRNVLSSGTARGGHRS